MKTVLVLLSLLIFTACQPQAEKKTACAAGQSFDSASRACKSSSGLTASPIQQVPVNSLASTSTNEDTAKIIYLSYGDANLDPALACNVAVGANLSAGACACTAGTCQFILTPALNFFGASSFTYTVTDNDGVSLPTVVAVSINSVDDAPVGTLSGSTAIFEDTLSVVGVTYTDVESDAASACTIINSTNLGVTTCACVAGVCSAQIQATANVSGVGIANFTYQVYANGSFSIPQYVTVNITALDDAPIGTTSVASTNEDTPVSVNLLYTDVESDVAASCNITVTNNVTVSTPCACLAGVCTVGITPNANLNSSNSTLNFTYTVTANALVSFPKLVTLTTAAVDDIPVGSAVAVSTNEDTAVIIALPFTDIESNTATACAISSLGGGTVGSCTCATSPATQCEVTFTPSLNLATGGSFQYTVTAGAGTSVVQNAVITINAVNDTPVLPVIADQAANEGTPFVVSFNIDEGGGTDEDAQNLTVTATSNNNTLLPNGNISVSFTEGGDASDDLVTLTLTPVGAQAGTATITIQVDDNGSPVGTVTRNFNVTVNPISAIHNGWKNLKALGDKINSSGAILEAKSVTLEWEDFSIFGASITGYNVYRFTNTYSSDISAATLLTVTPVAFGVNTYTDNSPALATGITYYYVVRPIDSVNGLPTATVEPATYVEIKIPDQNMSLLHRWAVNKEVCGKLGQTADETNHYRCVYNGPGATAGFYDLGAHQFIDRFEAGCNYTTAPKCTVNGCIGNGDPNVNGCSGSSCNITTSSVDLFYDRTSGTCYYTTNGSTWSAVDGAFTSNPLLAGTVAPAKAHLPPLSQVTQTQASQYCVEQGKRLVSRKEFVAAGAWDLSLNESDITNNEIGANIAGTPACNSSSGSGLTYTNGAVPPGASADTLPGSLVSSIRSVRTGSASTLNCSSRYGVQDLAGNLSEWSREQVNCVSDQHCDTVTPSDFQFPSNTYNFDGVTGPMLDSDLDDVEDGAGIFSNWLLENGSNNALKFFLPMGLPADEEVAVGVDMIPDFNIGSSITVGQLHQDTFKINADQIVLAGGAGAMTNGGHFSSGSDAGRYNLEFKAASTSDIRTGFRCIKTAP